MPQYRFDAEHSRFTVQAFVTGLFSFVGHSPKFAARDFEGQWLWEPGASEESELKLTVRADSLELIDGVRANDRDEIERRLRQEVLEVSRYPEIRFQSNQITSSRVSDTRYRVHLAGELSLHGVTKPEMIEAEVRVFHDGIRLTSEFSLRMSDFRIRPVTALGGTIRLKDQLQLSFDIAAIQEAT